MGQWSDVMKPIADKFEVGSNFGSATSFNKDGSAAMAKLLREIATKADTGIEVLQSIREKLVTISVTITSQEQFTAFDADELEPIEEMIREIDAALSTKSL